MDKIATENLFLLEFLVDKVDLDPSCDCGEVEGEKCVSFQFLDNAPLDVCEADFNPQRNYKSNCPKDTNLKSGKSCLFSLSPEQAEDAINKLDIYVLIYKKMPPDNWGSENIEIGSALISISNLFEELIDCITTSTGEESSSPTAKTLKDDFDISTSSGDICGKIGVYIRLSCFGKLIVTQFQMNLQDKSVLFKDKEGKSLYRYKKAGKGKNGGDKKCTPRINRINGNGGQNYNESCPTTPCGGDARSSQPRNSFNNQRMSGDFSITPSNSPMDPFDNSGKACVDNCPKKPCLTNQNGRGSGVGSYGGPPGFNVGGGQFNGGGVGCNVGQGGPMGFPGMGMGGGPGMGMGGGPGMGMGGFPGMGMGGGPGMGMGGGPGMGMNGGPGMMRQAPCLECGNIPNAACLPPAQFGGFPGGFGNGMPPGGFGNGMPPGSMGQPCSECSPCPMADDSKSDPEGNYHEIGASMGGNSLTIRVHKDNKVETVDDDETASCICKNSKNNNMNLNIQPGVQQAGKDLPFSFRMGQQGQGQGGGVVVNPPTCTAANGAKVTEFSDPNKELFVLRIGKKSEGVDKKQNLELELCTPKGPELKPIPQKKSTDTQYDPADAGPESKKGKGKGKGKKKK